MTRSSVAPIGSVGRRILSGFAVLAVAATLAASPIASPAAEARSKHAVPKADPRYAALVVDAETGTVLFDRNAEARRHPASLTKIMTLYMLFDALERGRVKMTDRLEVSKRAEGQIPSKLGLRDGETITVDDAIRALVTKSANDVAVVIAEGLAKNETLFAQAMTEKAHKLGMRDTQFRNASGVHNPGQVTTARDMATLAMAVRRDFPQYYHFFSLPEFDWRGVEIRNHNHLLGHYKGTDGVKTGYVNASGFNLVASVERNGRRLIGVVFGGETGPKRDRHMMALLDAGFQKASNVKVAKGEAKVRPARIEEPKGPPAKPQRVAAAEIPREAPPKQVPHTKMVAAAPEPVETTEAGSLDDAQWAIQVGAYSTDARALKSIQSARSHLPRLLAEADAMVEELNFKNGPVYRARLFGLTEDEARQACVTLRQRNLPCQPVSAKTAAESRPQKTSRKG